MDTKLNKIIHIEDDELSLNYKYRDGAEWLGNNISICSYQYDLLQLINEGFSFIPVEAQPEIGDTYVRDPFGEKVLIKIESLKDYVLEKKANCISFVARRMGATSFRFTLEIENIETREWGSDNKVGYKPAELDTSIKKVHEEKLNKCFALEKTYPGKRPTLNEYNEAIEKAKYYKIVSDNNVQSLFEERNPSTENLMTSVKRTFSLSEEINNCLDIALHLKALKGVFKLDSNFNSTTKHNYN